jgi:hypothetical protein
MLCSVQVRSQRFWNRSTFESLYKHYVTNEAIFAREILHVRKLGQIVSIAWQLLIELKLKKRPFSAEGHDRPESIIKMPAPLMRSEMHISVSQTWLVFSIRERSQTDLSNK